MKFWGFCRDWLENGFIMTKKIFWFYFIHSLVEWLLTVVWFNYKEKIAQIKLVLYSFWLLKSSPGFHMDFHLTGSSNSLSCLGPWFMENSNQDCLSSKSFCTLLNKVPSKKMQPCMRQLIIFLKSSWHSLFLSKSLFICTDNIVRGAHIHLKEKYLICSSFLLFVLSKIYSKKWRKMLTVFPLLFNVLNNVN